MKGVVMLEDTRHVKLSETKRFDLYEKRQHITVQLVKCRKLTHVLYVNVRRTVRRRRNMRRGHMVHTFSLNRAKKNPGSRIFVAMEGQRTTV